MPYSLEYLIKNATINGRIYSDNFLRPVAMPVQYFFPSISLIGSTKLQFRFSNVADTRIRARDIYLKNDTLCQDNNTTTFIKFKSTGSIFNYTYWVTYEGFNNIGPVAAVNTTPYSSDGATQSTFNRIGRDLSEYVLWINYGPLAAPLELWDIKVYILY